MTDRNPSERPEAEREPATREETEAERDEREASERVERDQHQRRPQTPPPDLSEAKRERDEYLELAQRTRADFENYRKRVAKGTSDALARGKAELARELLPVIDNLERALQAAGVPHYAATRGRELERRAVEAPSEEVSAHEALARGVALVLDELRGKLRAAGVESYDP